MKCLGLRARLTIWHAILLMIFLNIGFTVAYQTVRGVLVQQTHQSLEQSALAMAQKIQLNPDRSVPFYIRDENGQFKNNSIYILYDAQERYVDGNRLGWPDKLAPQYDKIRGVVNAGESWMVYDKALYDGAVHVGTLRTLFEVTSIKHSLSRMEYYWRLSLIPCLLLSILGGLWIAGRSLKPLKELTDAAQEIGAGDFSKRIKLSATKDEIGALSLAFNHMADNIQQSFEREKQFSSDASHELRTPLTVITAAAEDALLSGKPEVGEEALQVILDKGRQMQQMLIQLLILARDYEHAGNMELAAVDLTSAISDICDEAREWAQEKQISIETELEQSIMIKGDMLLLTRLFINLLTNAIQYGVEKGHIFIKARCDYELKLAFISVEDDGIGIAAEDLPHIFKRFYRADKARSGSSSGLGLALADLTVKLHYGKITVSSIQGQGACFNIELPLWL